MLGGTTCAPSHVALTTFIGRYSWLFTHHIAEFLTEDLWDRVPLEWREPLLALPEDALRQADLEGCTLPDSFRAFHNEAQALALSKAAAPLPRNCPKAPQMMCQQMGLTSTPSLSLTSP